MANSIESRLRANRFSYRVENVQYENASHLLMGFGPGQTELRVNERFTMRFGGTPEGTETARNSGWARVKQFLAGLGEPAQKKKTSPAPRRLRGDYLRF